MKREDVFIGMKVIRTKEPVVHNKNPRLNAPIGMIATVNKIIDHGNFIGFEELIGGWFAKNWEPFVEEVKAPIPQQPVPFVFIEEGIDYIKVGSGDYVSLEEANERCLVLRRIYNTDKIYSYVRVD